MMLISSNDVHEADGLSKTKNDGNSQPLAKCSYWCRSGWAKHMQI